MKNFNASFPCVCALVVVAALSSACGKRTAPTPAADSEQAVTTSAAASKPAQVAPNLSALKVGPAVASVYDPALRANGPPREDPKLAEKLAKAQAMMDAKNLSEANARQAAAKNAAANPPLYATPVPSK